MAYNNQAIKRDINGNPIPQMWNDATGQFEVLSKTEFYGLSTEAKPASDMIKGNSYFEIDTSKVFIYDGTKWVEI